MVKIVKGTRLLVCGLEEDSDPLYDHYMRVLSRDGRVDVEAKRCRALYEGNGVAGGGGGTSYDGALFCAGQNTSKEDVYSGLRALHGRYGDHMVCLVACDGEGKGDCADAEWIEHGFDGVMRGHLDVEEVLDRYRCLALLRDRWRGLGRKDSSEEQGSDDVLVFHEIALHQHRLCIEIGGHWGRLTAKEQDILALLMHSPDKVFHKDVIHRHIYPLNRKKATTPDIRIIDVYICKLRAKIESLGGYGGYIQTIWGGGYVLSATVVQNNKGRRSDDGQNVRHVADKRYIRAV